MAVEFVAVGDRVRWQGLLYRVLAIDAGQQVAKIAWINPAGALDPGSIWWVKWAKLEKS